MVLLVRLLILSLPFVAYPRLVGSIKVSDIVLLALIGAAVANHRLRPTRYTLGLSLFIIAFAVYGFFNINYFDPIAIVGGWDIGLLSTTAYQAVAAIQTLIYIFGFAVAARYMISPRHGLIQFLMRFFNIWSLAVILLFVIPPTRQLVSYYTYGDLWLAGTFPEKGVMAPFVAFTYALVLTYQEMPGVKRFNRWEFAAFVALVLVDLALCRSGRGTIDFIIFNIAYFFSKRPSIALKLIPAAIVVALAMIPLLGMGVSKIGFYLSFMGGGNDPSAIGRYAALLLFPKLFLHAPMLGLGYGNYIFYRTSEQFASFLAVVPKDEPDSIAIQVLLECGIVGAILFFNMVLVYPLRRLSASRLKFLWPFAIAYAVNLLEGITTYYQTWLLLFVLLEMIRVASAELRPIPEEHGVSEPQAGARWAIGLRRIFPRPD